MALDEEPEVLRRAAQAARDEPDDGRWIDVSRTVMDRVGSLARTGEPLLVLTGDGGSEHDEHGSRTLLSSRVVVTALRRLLEASTRQTPDRIALDVEDTHLLGVRLDLVAAYGVDLVALGEQVRDQVDAALTELLGPAPRRIDVEVVDVTEDDPDPT